MRVITLFVFMFASMSTPARCDERDVAEAIEARLVTAQDFLDLHPDRALRLFAALDLDREGLSVVREAAGRDDLAAASAALLDYYAQSDNGVWLRTGENVHDPGGFDDYSAMAKAAMRDEHTFQSVTGTLKRTASGTVDWYDRGPRDDLQWAIFNNRHFGLLPLLKAYRAGGEPEYAALIDAAIQDWVAHNYPAEEGANDKLLPANWKPMSSASRLLQVWPQVFYGLADEEAFSPAGRLMLLSSVPEQMAHLIRYHRRKHNHAVKEMIGLAHAAASFPEFRDAPKWRAYALEVLNEELDRQLYPTGVQKEGTAHYQRTVLEYLLQYVEFMRAAGHPLPRRFEARIEDMGGYLVEAMRPSGTIPLTNDSDLDDVRALALRLAGVFARPDWTYIATNGEAGEKPDGPPSRFYPYVGQLVARSGFDAAAEWLLFDIGPWGVSHQQNDKLHVSVARGGQDLIVDTGRFRYKGDDPLRQYVVGSAGHNVVLVDGAGQNPHALENDEPMRGAAHLSDELNVALGTFEAGFEGVEGRAVHRRGVAHIPGLGILVADEIETDRPRRLRAQWHMHPDLQPAIDEGSIAAATPRAGLHIQPAAPHEWSLRIAKGETDPPLGWYSPGYNRIDPAPLALFEAEIKQSARFLWFIQTNSAGEAPPGVDIRLLPAPDGIIRCRIEIGAEKYEIAMRLRGRAKATLGSGLRLDGAFGLIGAGRRLVAGGAIVDAADRPIATADWTY